MQSTRVRLLQYPSTAYALHWVRFETAQGAALRLLSCIRCEDAVLRCMLALACEIRRWWRHAPGQHICTRFHAQLGTAKKSYGVHN